MTEDIKSRIREIYEQENINSDMLFLFDQIPQTRLKNAIKKYASSLSGDETVILLYDSSSYGSGKDGCILTSKRIYCKNMLEKSKFADITEITGMAYSHVNPVRVCVETHNVTFTISTVLLAATTKIKLFNFLDKTIKLLLNPSAITATSPVGGVGHILVDTEIKCKG